MDTLDLTNVMQIAWAYSAVGVRILVIIFLAWLVGKITTRVTRRWTKSAEDLPVIHPRRQRINTTSDLVNSGVRYVIWPLALIMILSEFKINIGPLLASAGIAGLAIGFGAQTLVKDVISGMFMLFDDTLRVGNLITFQGQTGTVEHIGIRLIKVRKFDGELVMIPAGELRIFGNKSVDFARVIVEIGLAYEQNVDEILPVMNEIAVEWMEANPEKMFPEEVPEVQAITVLGDSSVTARIVFRVLPGEQFPAERAIRKRLKAVFDERGIEIPFPRRTIYVVNKDQSAKPQLSTPE
jgi:small conductance mechanosensitive channel